MVQVLSVESWDIEAIPFTGTNLLRNPINGNTYRVKTHGVTMDAQDVNLCRYPTVTLSHKTKQQQETRFHSGRNLPAYYRFTMLLMTPDHSPTDVLG